MRYIRNISDDQNKSGDTDNIFRLNLIQDDDTFNFGDYPISINIANSSGYILSMVPEKEFGNSVLKLDFNDQSLKSLTPDNYLLEVEVKFPDGTTATFPTKGGMPFTVNGNLKNTAGKLVPTVTFDEVLNAVDEKVNNYLATVQKGDKGDTGEKGEKGDPGVVDTAKDYTWTGTNTFNKKIIATTGVQGNADTATKLQTPRKINGTNFDGTADINVPASNDSDIVHKSGNENVNGAKTFNDFNTFKKPIQGGLGVRSYPFTTIAALSGNLVEYSGKWGVTSDKMSDLPQGGYAILTVYPYIDNGNSGFATLQYTNGNFYFSDINSANVLWKKVAKDSEVIHLTGTETVAGDKTFTGNNNFSGVTTLKTGNYGLRVTTSGVQKTSDGGTTWVNI